MSWKVVLLTWARSSLNKRNKGPGYCSPAFSFCPGPCPGGCPRVFPQDKPADVLGCVHLTNRRMSLGVSLGQSTCSHKDIIITRTKSGANNSQHKGGRFRSPSILPPMASVRRFRSHMRNYPLKMLAAFLGGSLAVPGPFCAQGLSERIHTPRKPGQAWR